MYCYSDTSEVYSASFFLFVKHFHHASYAESNSSYVFDKDNIKKEEKLNKEFENLEYRFKLSCIEEVLL